MKDKSRILLLFLVLLATAGLVDQIAFGSECTTGCYELTGFFENSKKWVVTLTPSGGGAREAYAFAPLPNFGPELSCKAKTAQITQQQPCTHICDSCPAAKEPCQLDNCTANPNGSELNFTCYEFCAD